MSDYINKFKQFTPRLSKDSLDQDLKNYITNLHTALEIEFENISKARGGTTIINRSSVAGGGGSSAVSSLLLKTVSGAYSKSGIVSVNFDDADPFVLSDDGSTGVRIDLTVSPSPSATVVGTGRTLTIAGTANRITSSAGAQDLSANRTWTLDIASTYVGQTSITTLGTIATGVWQGTLVGVTYGGTGANLAATGGASQYLKQVSVGAAITVGTIPASDIASGAAITKTDDTNVTLTLGGTPTTALLAATSLTLGWTGTLADARLSTTAVTPGSYGSATQVGTFTVGATGRLTAAGNTTITPAASSITGGANLSVGGSMQITAGSGTAALLVAATIDTIQDIRTTATPQWTKLGIGAAASATNLLTFTQAAASSGSPSAIVLTGGAHTTLANAEVIDANFNFARTVQFTGAVTLAEQRSVVFQSPTYSSDTATKTITDASTVCIVGTPKAGTNILFTNAWTLRIKHGIDTAPKLLIDGGSDYDAGLWLKFNTLNAAGGIISFQDASTLVATIEYDSAAADFSVNVRANKPLSLRTNSTERLVIAADGVVSIANLTHCLANFGATGNMTEISHVASGQVLTSAGTTTAPAWSASPTLTGLTLSGLTAGSILFAGTAGVLSQDNANFFYGNAGLPFLAVGNTATISSSGGATTTVTVMGGSSANSRGNVEIGNKQVLAANTVVGDVSFVASDNSSGLRMAIVRAITVGSTANNRGADFQFFVKPDAGAIAEAFHITSDRRVYGLALHNNAGAVTGTTNQYIASGTYSPAVTASTNTDLAVTASAAQWTRVGNTVIVSGEFTADPLLAATTTSFELALPVASNIANTSDLAGTAVCGNIASMSAQVSGVVANDTAKIFWKSSDVTSQTWSYIFHYEVL